MKVAYENSIEYQALQLIESNENNVLLRDDFLDLGSYRQVSRVLAKLMQQGKLAKIGFGVYAKAYKSQYLDKPLINGGFDTVVREALDRMQVKWTPSKAEQEYNSGESQQVPTQNTIRLKSRLRRKLRYENRELQFEKNINAK